MEKKRIGILFGGCSPEYGVSLKSAYSVITNIDEDKYETVLIGITRDGCWRRFTGEPEAIRRDCWTEHAHRAVLSPDRADHGLIELGPGGVTVTRLDAVFPVLHGKNGEDGTVQGLTELAGIPLVGCDTLGSAVGMDKELSHRLVEKLGIRVPQGILLWGGMAGEEILRRTRGLGYPLFVKPVRAGSSFGITRVEAEEQLLPAVEAARVHDDQVIVEAYIPGFEVGCAVLGTHDLITGQVDEIQLDHGFFDYTEKYTLKTSTIHMPARIPKAVSDRVRETAKVIYRGLKLRGFARVDLFYTPEGELVFNEVNTIPGFTSASRYPGMLRGIGYTYPQIIDALIQDALDREGGGDNG